MKKLIIFVFALGVAGILNAQIQTISDSNTTSSERTDKVEEIEKQISKLEKKISKSDKNIKKSEKDVDDATIDMEYNGKQQLEYLEKIAEVKNSMNGHDLEALNEKVSRLEKNERKLNSTNNRNEKLIAKKYAEIERLKSEIQNLEDDVRENDYQMEETKDGIEDTENIITKNALVEKSDRLNDLNKDLEELRREEKKLNTRIAKGKNISKREKQLLDDNARKKEELNLEKLKLSNPESTTTIPN